MIEKETEQREMKRERNEGKKLGKETGMCLAKADLPSFE